MDAIVKMMPELWLVMLGVVIGFCSQLRRTRRYMPQQLLKGSQRANEMMREVDAVLLMVNGFLQRNHPTLHSSEIRCKTGGGCEWVLTVSSEGMIHIECKLRGNTAYVFGRGRSHSPSFRDIFAIYRSMPKFLKKITRTFPLLSKQLDEFLELAEH